jgi:hypothetical protein
LVKGKTVGIDATTLEANAALRSIVRRGSGPTARASKKSWATGPRVLVTAHDQGAWTNVAPLLACLSRHAPFLDA